jgi:hypothetical protein
MTTGHLGRFPFGRFPLSTRVDLLRLFARATSVVRLRPVEDSGPSDVKAWAAEAGLAVQVDRHGYVAIGRTQDRARRLLRVDASVDPHEEELGRLLDYPDCCVKAIAAIGEGAIDRRAAELSTQTHRGRFRLIEIAGYRDGLALVSHVPCSSACEPTLELAERALTALDELRELPQYATLRAWAGPRRLSMPPGRHVDAALG